MPKRIQIISCILFFLFLCTGTVLFLSQFTSKSDAAFIFVEWQDAYHIDADGTKTSISPEALSDVSSFTKGETYVLHTTLNEPSELESLHFETAGASISFSVNGEEIYHSNIQMPADSINTTMADIPLQPFWNDADVVLTWSPLDPENTSLPMLRIISDSMTQTFNMSFASRTAIPTGAFAVVFLLVCGIFQIGLVLGRPDYSLVPLSIAGCILTVREIVISMGYYFLPEKEVQILSWQGFSFLPLILIAVYLLLNRKRAFLRYLKWIFLFTLILFGAAYAVSSLFHGSLALLVKDAVTQLFQFGYYDLALYWITAWFVLAGACIAAYALFHEMIDLQMENSTMALKNQALLDNYKRIEERHEQAAALRHEMRHHILAVTSLYNSGNSKEIGEYLKQLNDQTEQMIRPDFTKNVILNSILHNAAARAEQSGIDFTAAVQVPENLNIDAADLCSFVMNLLDNALEACMRMNSSDRRFIHFKASLLLQGHLAMQCDNSHSDKIKKDPSGKIKSIKEDQFLHGYGLKQMTQIARKYNCPIDISYTESVFTVIAVFKNRN